MRKYFALLFLVVLGAAARAQTVSMPDLTNLATLNTPEATNFLMQAKPFKQLYTQQVEGLTVGHYQVPNTSKLETVVIGDGTKTSSGTLLHLVNYSTNQPKYILNLIAQAGSTGLNMVFRGSDQFNNIYLFDNFLYTVYVYLKADNTGGTVQVKQKDYMY